MLSTYVYRVGFFLLVLNFITILPNWCHAAPTCDRAAVQSAFGNNVDIHDIQDWGALNVASPQGGTSHLQVDSTSFCAVTGDFALSDEHHDRANFAAMLPDTWNGKVLQVGCGGNCGRVFLGAAPTGWVSQGYAVWATDDGHVAGHSPAPRLWDVVESSWAQLPNGKPDIQRQSAFLHRAVHALAINAKSWTQAFYHSPSTAAYFAGCSDGGREALVEAEQFPNDFDGIIAGDPYFDIEGEVASALAVVDAQMQSPDASLGAAQWRLADKIILAKCDATDGVKDGLIQNPARCDFRAERDLPKCDDHSHGECFTTPQINALNVALSAMSLSSGEEIYPGYPSSDLADGDPRSDNLRYWVGFDLVPGGWKDPASQPEAWYFGNQTLKYFAGISDLGLRDAMHDGVAHATVQKDAYDRLRNAVKAGDATDPAALAAFIKSGHKLIMYHGLADGDITPYRTLNFYRALAKLHGGFGPLAKSAVLFSVPGMAHCGAGPGPNDFGQRGSQSVAQVANGDILHALDAWVGQGTPPVSLTATHGAEKTGPLRTMPLCPYPAMARYKGHGDINDAVNWRCDSQDQRMLETGPAGVRAGYR